MGMEYVAVVRYASYPLVPPGRLNVVHLKNIWLFVPY